MKTFWFNFERTPLIGEIMVVIGVLSVIAIAVVVITRIIKWVKIKWFEALHNDSYYLSDKEAMQMDEYYQKQLELEKMASKDIYYVES